MNMGRRNFRCPFIKTHQTSMKKFHLGIVFRKVLWYTYWSEPKEKGLSSDYTQSLGEYARATPQLHIRV